MCRRIINLVHVLHLLDEFDPICSSIHSRASDYGLLKIDESGQIVQFSEKPKGDDLKAMVMVLMFFSKHS